MPFVSVRITKDGVSREQKAQVIAEITETLQRVLNKRPELTHIVIEEVDTDNWGYAGMTTTELEFSNTWIERHFIMGNQNCLRWNFVKLRHCQDGFAA